MYNWLLAGLAVVAVSSCLFVPYTPDAEVFHLDLGEQDIEAVSLTTWPQDGMKKMGKMLRSVDSRIEIAPSSEFRDAVFPDPTGSKTIATLLAPESEGRVMATEVDYLVAFSRIRLQWHSVTEAGVGVPPAIMVGYGRDGVNAHLSALVIGLRVKDAMDVIVSESDAQESGAILGLVVVGVIPRAEHSVRKALVREIVNSLQNSEPNEPIRLVLMTAESFDTHSHPLPEQLDVGDANADPTNN